MNRSLAVPGLVLIALAYVDRPALAEWVSFEELHVSCTALRAGAAEDGSTCRAFVHGYLLGSQREASAQQQARKPAESESWSDRAARTRLNPALLHRAQGARTSQYCIDHDTGLDEVVRAVADHISIPAEPAEDGTGAVVHQALVKSFPCDA